MALGMINVNLGLEEDVGQFWSCSLLCQVRHLLIWWFCLLLEPVLASGAAQPQEGDPRLSSVTLVRCQVLLGEELSKVRGSLGENWWEQEVELEVPEHLSPEKLLET